MRQCAFLSMDDLSNFEAYDHLTFKPMAEHGWQVSEVSWRDQNVDWNAFEAVVIRSPWDYQDAAADFIDTLKRIDKSRACLLNSLDTVLWNINKSYLQDFERQGIPIVPTRWMDTYSDVAMHGAYETWGTPEIIIKPQVSANADDTFRLSPIQLSQKTDALSELFYQRPHMLQPFVSAVVDEGEFSLFYFSGEYSHAILKRPKQHDFRVQEEHGGQLQLIEPEPSLRAAGDAVIEACPESMLYARVDLLRHGSQFLLMELEAIEPSLYFNMDEKAATHFAGAFSKLF